MQATPRVTSGLLGFTAGYVDTCGFVALFNLFTAHVTGNFVVIGASLVDHRPGVTAKLLALPTFVVVVGLTHLVVSAVKRRGGNGGRFALVLQATLLALFMGLGLRAGALTPADADAVPVILTGLIGVAAMAVQNAASRTAFASLVPTTVMTGNVTQMTIDAADLLRGAADPAARGRFQKMWPPVLAFAAGAILGALGIARFGFWCLLLPIAAVAILAAVASDPSTENRSEVAAGAR